MVHCCSRAGGEEQAAGIVDSSACDSSACDSSAGKPRLVSWYANPTAEQVRAPKNKKDGLASEESRVWVLEVCEDWRTCHICGKADRHTDACNHPGTATTRRQVVRGFKLWELKSAEDPADGGCLGKYWYSNLDARPDDVDESDGMRVGEQRFTAWHRSFVKFNMLPFHWVRVHVNGGQKMFKKKMLRYVTICDELAERDRAYEVLARAPAIIAAVQENGGTKKGKKGKKVLVDNAAACDDADGAACVAVVDGSMAGRVTKVGVLGGASGEAVLPEEVVVIGMSARGRVLKRREVLEEEDIDDDFLPSSITKSAKAAAGTSTSKPKKGKPAPKKSTKSAAKTSAAAAAREDSAGGQIRTNTAVTGCGGDVLGGDLARTPLQHISGIGGDDRRLSVVPTTLKTFSSALVGGKGVVGQVSPTCMGSILLQEGVHAILSQEGSHTMRLVSGVGSGGAGSLHAAAMGGGMTRENLLDTHTHTNFSCSGSKALSEGGKLDVAGAGGFFLPQTKRKRGPYKKKGKPADVRVHAAGGVGGGGSASGDSGEVSGPRVVEVSSDDEADVSQKATQQVEERAFVQARGDDVFELLLWMITVGDLGGGQTVFQLLGNSKNYLIKASILFGTCNVRAILFFFQELSQIPYLMNKFEENQESSHEGEALVL